MRVVSLLENTTELNGFGVEHGLSLYVESNGYKILFDMGQTDLFYKNAKKLKIDLSEVDFAVLSHGHYDHGGGLEKFLQINQKARVYVHKQAFLPHYNGTQKYIGLNCLLKDNPRIEFVGEEYEICDKINLFTCNDKQKIYPLQSSGLNVKRGEEFVADDFCHEQYLLIEENSKRVLFSGCSHKGVLNVVEWFKPDVFIGGFHFSKMAIGEELKNATQKLAQYKTKFFTCHCTGKEQFGYMKDKIPSLEYLSCGQEIEI